MPHGSGTIICVGSRCFTVRKCMTSTRRTEKPPMNDLSDFRPDDPWGQTASPWLKIVGGLLSTVGFLVVVAANLLVLWAMYGYFLSSARLPPGTGVRPMGLTFFCSIVGLGSILVGLPVSALGRALCDRAQFRAGANLAKVGQSLSWLALPLGPVLMFVSNRITGVVLSP